MPKSKHTDKIARRDQCKIAINHRRVNTNPAEVVDKPPYLHAVSNEVLRVWAPAPSQEQSH